MSYRAWREQIPQSDRKGIPSATALVPYTWRSWSEARVAAGIDIGPVTESPNGPRPKWSVDDCYDWVVKWLHSDRGKTLAAFTDWIDSERRGGEPAPSAATIRLRIGRPWSEIVAEARGRSDV